MKQLSTLVLTGLLACAATISYADNTTANGNIALPKQDSSGSAATSGGTASYVNSTSATNAAALSTPSTPAAPATPQSPLTGNFDITTNYVFRGISNSNNNPAFQGGLTYTFLTTGIYLNVWGSNVNFADPYGNTATVEADTIIGITNSINDNWSYNINFDRYNYPKASAANYNEMIAALTYKIFTATIGDSLNVYGSHSRGIYYNGLFTVPISEKLFHMNDLTAQASWGHYSLPRNAGLYSYSDIMVGLQKTIGQYVLSAQYTNTNHKAHMSGLDTGTLVAMLTVNF